MSEYYQPTIEEFYIGFEYEQIENCSIKGNPKQLQWNKKKFGINMNMSKALWQLITYPEETRVKFLDKEDIESLGFKFIGKNNTEHSHYQLYKRNSRTFYSITIESNVVIIELHEATQGSKYNSSVLFKGILKNKSELLKIMKYLDISIKDEVELLQEDIEELGFICIQKSKNIGNFYRFKELFYLHHIPEEEIVTITKIIEYNPDGLDKYERIFKDKIITKEELIKVLTGLKII